MRRILIADDEILVRVGLGALLDWKAAGYEIVGEAASGEEALRLLPGLEPDLVLTDLVMGPGDGFALIRGVRELSSTVGLVVLSCRNDFEAVREAMRLGADDYVFKLTMRGEEVLEVLARVGARRPGWKPAAAGEGARTGPSGSAAPPVPQGPETPTPLSPLARLAAGQGCGAAELEAELERLGLAPTFLNAYQAAVFAPPAPDPGRPPPPRSAEAFVQAIRELRRRDLPDFAVLPFTEGRALVLVRGERRGEAREVAAGVDEYARRYFGRPAAGGLSPPARGAEGLAAAAAAACSALAYAFFAGPGLHEAAALPPELPLDDAALSAEGRAFKAAVRGLEEAAMRASVGRLFEALRRARGAAPDLLRGLVWDFLAPLRDRARSARVDLDGAEGAGAVPAHLAFLMGGDLPSLELLALDYVGRAAARIGASTAARCRPEILRVMDAVAADPARTLSVDEAASLAAMSPSHFEHVFTREAGSSFLRYQTRAKMERALELLLGEDLRIYEVAARLGYENPNYFSTMFKQVTGMTPQEARGAAPRRGGSDGGGTVG